MYDHIYIYIYISIKQTFLSLRHMGVAVSPRAYLGPYGGPGTSIRCSFDACAEILLSCFELGLVALDPN